MPSLSMTVNGELVSLDVEPDEVLADVLRDRLGLIGTKIGCREGECGACTVLVDGDAVVSCLYPALKAQGREIVTIEGLGRDGELDPVQQAFIEAAAAQCGYCTPGFIMVVKALLDRNPRPTPQEIEEGLAGNLCRCTGYYQIKEAVQLAVERLAARGGVR
ncbi:MAG: (2Fe-2S)-binding protein [Anaerolineae bacterium]|nr:(2Fe-2S)-binding protein [Anaerolineae bacterium]